MSTVAAYGSAAGAILRRDIALMLSYRFRVVAQVATTLFTLTLFYYISRLVSVETFASPDDYFAFAVIGIITLQVVNATLLAPPAAMRQELVAGTFERLAVSPFGPVNGVISMLLFPLVQTLIIVAVTLAFAAAVFGLDLEWPSALLAAPVGILAALSFAPFGIAVLALVTVMKQAAATTSWIVAAMSLIAGLYFPVTLLPDWIQWSSDVQPLTPAVELMRNVLVGTPLTDPLWADLARLVGFAAVLTPAAMYLLGRAINVSRRRGTIIEY
jgi:ABC-2 type transport system permease protein